MEEEVIGDTDAASDRLRELREQKASEPDGARRLLVGGLVVCALALTFFFFLPRMLDNPTPRALLVERSLAYCKYKPIAPKCEERIRKRAEMCFDRDSASEGWDVFGRCMHEEFEDYYVRVADSLPK